MERKTSSEWHKEYLVTIIDPSGWDRDDFEYSFSEEEITKNEFETRLFASTVKYNKKSKYYKDLIRLRGMI